MNEENLSNIPVSELVKRVDPAKLQTELDKNNNSGAPRKPKNRLPIIIGAIVLAIGIGVGLYFLLRKPATPTETEEPEQTADVVWEPDDDSTNAAGDFIDHQQQIVDNPDATDDEKIQALLETANLYTVMEKYDESLTVLDGINREGLSYRSLFGLYSAYAYLYEHKGDEAKRVEYETLGNELMASRWEDEEANGPQTDGEKSE